MCSAWATVRPLGLHERRVGRSTRARAGARSASSTSGRGKRASCAAREGQAAQRAHGVQRPRGSTPGPPGSRSGRQAEHLGLAALDHPPGPSVANGSIATAAPGQQAAVRVLGQFGIGRRAVHGPAPHAVAAQVAHGPHAEARAASRSIAGESARTGTPGPAAAIAASSAARAASISGWFVGTLARRRP